MLGVLFGFSECSGVRMLIRIISFELKKKSIN